MPKEEEMSLLSRTTLSLFALMSLLMLQSGCATDKANKSLVWHSRDQFVALVDRDDQGAERQVPNQQPITVSRHKLSAELASLWVKYPGKEKAKRLFDEPEVRLLSEQVLEALQQARSDQDVIFAVYGKDPILKGLAAEEVVTTARAFYRDNSLNLILGMVRERVREPDRRLQPFVPGARAASAPMPAQISSSSEKVTRVPNRPDWLVLQVPVGTAADLAEPEAQPEGAIPVAPGTQKAVPARSIEERLKTLGELKAKGLITEEEYRAKKESILKEL